MHQLSFHGRPSPLSVAASMIRHFAIGFILAAYFCSEIRADSITFDWVTVGNAGNAADSTTGYGAVSYTYNIAKTEVTNAQYVEFLRAKAATDTHGLYATEMGSETWGGIVRTGSSGSYGYSVKPAAPGQGPGGTDYRYDDKPVVYVSFFDAMRFVNWLHNGQGNGDTETGVYAINDGLTETRSLTATYWIPSQDEWYKAAYHDASAGAAGVYFDYPTGTDNLPNNNLPSSDTGNSANIYDSGWTTSVYDFPMTDVGSYTQSSSPYGTFDQGGNVYEWNEAVSGNFRQTRGGDWNSNIDKMLASEFYYRHPQPSDSTLNVVGFRVASVPEPNSFFLVCLLSFSLVSVRRRGQG